MKQPKTGKGWPRTIKSGAAFVKVYRMQHASAATGWTYVLAWNTPEGRKRQKYATEEDALEEARLKAENIAAGRVIAADMGAEDRAELKHAREIAGDVPLIAALKEWKTVRDLTGGNSITAAKAWAAKQGIAYTRANLEDVQRRFLDAKKKGGFKVTKTYKVFRFLVEKFGGRPIDAVSTLELGTWMQERFPAPAYFNTARKRFVTLWGWARKNGFLPRDVQTVAEMVDSAREAPTTIGIIDMATAARLLHFFQTEHKRYVAPLVLALFAGLRSAEVHGQAWEDIDLKGGHVRVTAAKPNTPSRRLVPLDPAAIEWLMTCNDRTGLVCDNLAIDRIREIARAASFELPENCFRHSYISHKVAATGDVNRTALDAGNSVKIVFGHYRQLVTEEEGSAWFEITPASAKAITEENGVVVSIPAKKARAS